MKTFRRTNLELTYEVEQIGKDKFKVVPTVDFNSMNKEELEDYFEEIVMLECPTCHFVIEEGKKFKNRGSKIEEGDLCPNMGHSTGAAMKKIK